MNKRILLGILPLATLILIGCGGAKGGSIATVNGEVIGKDDFYKEMEFKQDATIMVNPQSLQTAGNQIPAQPVAGAIVDGNVGFETLKAIVDQKIIMEIAADQGVSPTKADIDAEIDEIKRDNPTSLTQALSTGYSLDYLRDKIAVRLAQEKILTRGINITPKEVDDYVAQNPQDAMYYKPEGVLVQYIVAKPADKAKVDNDLTSGKQFALVASQYSIDQSAAANNYHLFGNGQDPVPVTSYEKKVQDIITKTAEGQTTAWYPQGQGEVKFYIERKVPAQKMTIDADLRKKLTRALAEMQGRKAIDIDKEKLDKLKAAKIVVTDPMLKALWDKYDKQLKSQPTSPTPSASTPPSPAASPTAGH